MAPLIFDYTSLFQVSAQMLLLCPLIYHSLWLFCFPSQHLPLLEIISVCMFIVHFPMRTGTRPIVYKSVNTLWMNSISWFHSSNRSFRVDTVKLQHRYQQLQRLVHPDFFSQRSQVAYWPHLIIPKYMCILGGWHWPCGYISPGSVLQN